MTSRRIADFGFITFLLQVLLAPKGVMTSISAFDPHMRRPDFETNQTHSRVFLYLVCSMSAQPSLALTMKTEWRMTDVGLVMAFHVPCAFAVGIATSETARTRRTIGITERIKKSPEIRYRNL